jgi:hypothetical protein
MVEKALASSVQALKERDLEPALVIAIVDSISQRTAVRLFRRESIAAQYG